MAGVLVPALILLAGGGGWLEYMRNQVELGGVIQSNCELTEAAPAGQACESGRRPVLEAREALAVSEILLRSDAAYQLIGSGDGDHGLVGRAPAAGTVNCTSAFDSILAAAAHGVSVAPSCQKSTHSRYFPGMENSYFGRTHFYETQWRPNILNRGFARDVTACVPPQARRTCNGNNAGSRGDSYRFRTDAREFEELMTRNLSGAGRGRLFLSHWKDPSAARAYVSGLDETSCAEMFELHRAVRLDWPHAEEGGATPAGVEAACATAGSRRALGESYVRLIDEIVRETRAGLERSPIEAEVPCLGFGSGASRFDPDRDLPAGWKHEGVVLYVGLLSSEPAWTRNKLAVSHQGMLVFRGGRWVFRHASRDKGGFVEVPFGEYLRKSRFVGMNLLAP